MRLNSNTWVGVARHAPRTNVSTITLGGASRRIYRYSENFQQERRAVMLVTSHAYNSTTNFSAAQIRMITVHELGHLMGYSGHSPTGVMQASLEPVQQILTQAERAHIRQIYDRFRD